MPDAEIFAGVMSGTSLDGMDAVLVDFSGATPKLLAAAHHPFPASLRDGLLRLNRSGHDELHRAALLGADLAHRYAMAVNGLLADAGISKAEVQAIGCHGQTVRHRPDLGYTIQIGNAARLTEETGITTVSDFRSRDMAAGGQGAPLVPAFHEAAFAGEAPRAILNLGGIANVTVLVAGAPTMGFDCGPGNVLLDGWCERHAGLPFDRDGAWAAGGTPIPELLARLLAHPFCEAPPPKSTGRDDFNLGWLDALLPQAPVPRDVQATLAEFTAEVVARAARRWFPQVTECYVCGGGARNSDLLERLRRCWPGAWIATSDALGIGPEWVEATAFAWLAHRTMRGEAGNLPAVTGARAARVLGSITPR